MQQRRCTIVGAKRDSAYLAHGWYHADGRYLVLLHKCCHTFHIFHLLCRCHDYSTAQRERCPPVENGHVKVHGYPLQHAVPWLHPCCLHDAGDVGHDIGHTCSPNRSPVPQSIPSYNYTHAVASHV